MNGKTRLTIRTPDFERIRRALFDARTEHMAFGLAGIRSGSGTQTFLLRELIFPTLDAYEFQAAGGVRLSPAGVCQVMNAVREYPVLVDMHNHVVTQPRFSGTDNAEAKVQYRILQDFSRGAILLQIVFGPDGTFQARWTEPSSYPQWRSLDELRVVGPGGMSGLHPWNEASEGQRYDEIETWAKSRHSRTLPIIGERPLHAIAGTRLGIVGLGGTGSAFLAQARFFFRDLVLVDNDIVEKSNLGRLFGAFPDDADNGVAKVEVMARELRRHDPAIRVVTVAERFPGERSIEVLKECDAIVACVDNNLARYNLAEFAARHLIPLVEMGCGLEMRDGRVASLGCQVRFQVPGGPCLACLNLPLADLEAEETTAEKVRSGYIRGTDLTPGEIVHTNSTAASIAMRNLLAYLGGHLPRPVPAFVAYDEVRVQLYDFTPSFPAREDCPLCGSGEASIAGWGDHLPVRLTLTSSDAAREESSAFAAHDVTGRGSAIPGGV